MTGVEVNLEGQEHREQELVVLIQAPVSVFPYRFSEVVQDIVDSLLDDVSWF